MNLTLAPDEFITIKIDGSSIEFFIDLRCGIINIEGPVGEIYSTKLEKSDENEDVEEDYDTDDEYGVTIPCHAIVYGKGVSIYCGLEKGHSGKHEDRHGKTRKDYKLLAQLNRLKRNL